MGNNLETLLPIILQELSHLPECQEESFRIIHHCFGISRFELLSRSREGLNPGAVSSCMSIIQRRKKGEPLAYILGYFFFYQDQFPVSPETLIPRYDTEHLVTAALALNPQRVLDIGTGTGVIALSLAKQWTQTEIHALDIVRAPFEASVKSLGNRGVSFHCIDFLDESCWDVLGTFDLIISNPPYLDDHDMERLDSSVKDWEPHSALYGGITGLVFYQKIAQFCQKYLVTEGHCILEVDHKYQQVADLFHDYDISILKDYNQLERVLIAKK